jgi:ankyrin repeat protein
MFALIKVFATLRDFDYCRYTPVHLASMNGHVEIVKLLLENTEDSSGNILFNIVRYKYVNAPMSRY